MMAPLPFIPAMVGKEGSIMWATSVRFFLGDFKYVVRGDGNDNL